MDRTGELFCEMLSEAVHGQKPLPRTDLSDGELSALYGLAQIHRVTPLLYEALAAALPAGNADLASFTASLRRSVRAGVAAQIRVSDDYLRLLAFLTAHGLHPMSVKGIVCRGLYPNPDLRVSADEDILVVPRELDACRALAEEYGMVSADPAGEGGEQHVFTYILPASGLHIEIHRALFSPSSKVYGEFNRFFEPERMLSAAVRVPVYGTEILSLCHTDHLLYLILHAFKHFMHSGFGLRQVCDIALYAARYGAEVDWGYICRVLGELRAEKFVAVVFRIGRERLGIDVPTYPETLRSVETDEDPLLDDLLQSGIYGGAGAARLHSSNITLTAIRENRSGKKSTSGFKAWLHSVFPPAISLEWKYTYLRRHKWLLPWAWICRICGFVFRRRSEKGSAGETLRIGQERVELMRKYGIID